MLPPVDNALAALIPRLEKAVLDSEQRRETRMNQVSDALTSLVSQLQGLPLPSDISRPLKKLAKKLDGGVAQSRELPPLLGELSGLQGRALSALGKPEEERPGFLQRFITLIQPLHKFTGELDTKTPHTVGTIRKLKSTPHHVHSIATDIILPRAI